MKPKPKTRIHRKSLPPVQLSRRRRVHPFSAVAPFLLFLGAILLVLASLTLVFRIGISGFAFAVLAAVISMLAAAILYAYDVHAREPEEEDLEALLRTDLRRSKDLVRESNRYVYQYLK